MFKIKLSENMAEQVESIDDKFESERQAYMAAIQKYGSALENSPMGYAIVEE